MAIDRRLKEATAVIRSGDKETGKELLLDILQDEPQNDKAWVWMSAVVETDNLRLECLEEALKYNPDNRTAQNGVAKLHKKMGQETAVMPSSSTSTVSVSSQAQSTVEYLCKRLIIEKWYQIWVPVMAPGYYEENPISPFVDPGNFKFSVPVSEMAELTPLEPYFDVILFRQTGGTFTIVCLTVRDRRSKETHISQDTLIEVGRDCLVYSPVVAYGQQSPVSIEIWELFERDITVDDETRMKEIKRMPGRAKVSVVPVAIDLVSHEVKHAYQPGLMRVFRPTYKNLINRWLKEEHSFSEEKTIQALMNGGVKLLPIFLGVFIGIMLTLFIQFSLLMLEWQSGWFVDAIGAFTTILIAIYTRSVRVENAKQGAIAAGIYAVIYYGLMWVLFGYWLGIIWLWNIGWMIALGALLGRVTDP